MIRLRALCGCAVALAMLSAGLWAGGARAEDLAGKIAPDLSVPQTASIGSQATEAANNPADGDVAGAQMPPRKLPRFVTLRPETVNVRSGPGLNYPIEWVFQRRGLPVEVVAEYDTWRKIRDFEATEGWVHQSMLSSQRGFIITGDVRPLRHNSSDAAKIVARLEPGVVGNVKECLSEWCKIAVAGVDGWLRRSDFWGTYPQEDFE